MNVNGETPALISFQLFCRVYYNEQVFNERDVILPHTGEVIAAYFAEDGCWYRARVIDSVDNTLIVSLSLLSIYVLTSVKRKEDNI